MLNFIINIEFDAKTYESNNEQWISDFIEQITPYVALTQNELQDYAIKVKQSIERNLFTSRTFTGASVEVLSPVTIAKKGHSKVFFDTGELYRSILTRKIPNGYEIFVAPGRSKIAYDLQVGKGRMPARPFFGIIPERADAFLDEVYKKGIRRVA